MAQTVEVDVKGFVEQINHITQAQAKRAIDLTKPMKRIAIMMQHSFQQNFDAQGRPDPWKPLKLSTLVARYYKTHCGKTIAMTIEGRRELHAKGKGYYYKRGYREGAPREEALQFVGNAKILEDTGALMRSYIYSGRQGSVQRIYSSIIGGATILEMGSNLPYAAVQDMGSRDGKIPARPIAVIQKEDDEAIQRTIEEWILGPERGKANG